MRTDLQEALDGVRSQYQLSFSYPPNPEQFVALVPQLFNVAIKLCDVGGVLRTW